MSSFAKTASEELSNPKMRLVTPAPKDYALPAIETSAVVQQCAESSVATDSDSDDEDLHPLFWTSLPKSAEGNDVMESLSKMVYDGKTAPELALHFKELGNEFYQAGTKQGYNDALGYYKQALDWAKKCKGTPEDRRCMRLYYLIEPPSTLRRKITGPQYSTAAQQ